VQIYFCRRFLGLEESNEKLTRVWQMCISRSGVAEDSDVLGCDAMSLEICRNVLPSRSRLQQPMHSSLDPWSFEGAGCTVHSFDRRPSWSEETALHPRSPETAKQRFCCGYGVMKDPGRVPRYVGKRVVGAPYRDSEDDHRNYQLSLIKELHNTAYNICRMCGFVGQWHCFSARVI
jgi:hypothetical protein